MIPTAEYAEPYHDPLNPLRMDRHQGQCHVCQEFKAITYCSFCKHWMCAVCREDLYARGEAAVENAIGVVLMKLWLKRVSGPCCGPRETA